MHNCWSIVLSYLPVVELLRISHLSKAFNTLVQQTIKYVNNGTWKFLLDNGTLDAYLPTEEEMEFKRDDKMMSCSVHELLRILYTGENLPTVPEFDRYDK